MRVDDARRHVAYFTMSSLVAEAKKSANSISFMHPPCPERGPSYCETGSVQMGGARRKSASRSPSNMPSSFPGRENFFPSSFLSIGEDLCRYRLPHRSHLVARTSPLVDRHLLLRSLLGLLGVFGLATCGLYGLWQSGPLVADRGGDLRFPASFEQLRRLTDVLMGYRDENYAYIFLLFSVAYLYKQTFAIPGSLFMNVLGGALFGRWKAAALICPLTAIGASCCFLLSRAFAQPFVERCFEQRLNELRLAVSANRYRLSYFLLCARLFPFSPNWLLNICSPFVNIPLTTFFLSVFVGLAPYNVLCVQAGGLIGELHSASQILDLSTILELFAVALVVLLFGLLVKRRQ